MTFELENNSIKVNESCIYTIPFPFTDLSDIKYRPALALDNPDHLGDVRFLFITTTPIENEKQGFKLVKEDYSEIDKLYKICF